MLGIGYLLDAIYPPRCVVCAHAGAVVCAGCLSTMHPPDAPICARCGSTITGAGFPAPQFCADCSAGHSPTRLDGIRVATDYAGAARTALLALKFAGQRRVAEPLASLMAAPFQCDIHTADMVIPVPLHSSRLGQRGYNQAELLARAFSRQQGIAIRTDILVRSRATEAQTRLSRGERRRNVAGAFTIATPAAAAAVTGKRILLIDDVTTTGSTLDAAAEPLRAANAASVWAMAFARPAPGATDAHDAS